MNKIKPILVILLCLSLFGIWYVMSVFLLQFVLDDYSELLLVVSILSLFPVLLLFKCFAPSMRVLKTKMKEKYVCACIVCGVLFFLAAKLMLLHFEPYKETVLDSTLKGILGALLDSVIIASVVEELFFRHWLVSYLDKYGYSYSAKMMVSAMLFFGGHILPVPIHGVWMMPYWRIDTLLFGVVSYWVYMKTKDVRYCVIFHMTHNLCSSIIYPLIVC